MSLTDWLENGWRSSPASSQREEAKENPALQMSRFQEHFPLALSDQDFHFIRKFMDEISGEKGNCDKNHRKLGRPERKKPVSPETSWVRKCISLRNVENSHLFCGNDIANEKMVFTHSALQLQNGVFREFLGKKSHWKSLPWFMTLWGLLWVILPHHSLDTEQTQLWQTHWDLE